MTKHIGILTAGGDSPGLNAAIRGAGKAAQGHYGMQMIGFLDGFRGLVDNRFKRLEGETLSGILTRGGTILGTSRDKPHRMLFGGKVQDMTDVIVDNYHANHLDTLICIGGGGTQKNKRVFGLVIDFGTSQSPKSTRPLTTYLCPSRPGHPALRNNFASSLLLRTWLPMTGRRVRRPTLFSLWRKARRENSAASRLLGSTSLRFALHGWQRALKLLEKGLNIITLPKTIDNDVGLTDVTFGFDTALGIATDAIDRLHSTAHSHHRIIVVEIMGHRAGWLALGAGIAGGADVILLPEIPYDLEVVADAIRKRSRSGKNFSIVAVAEGALPTDKASMVREAEQRKLNAANKKEKKDAKEDLAQLNQEYANHTVLLSRQLEQMTGLESRVTILGHLQRGGTPSAADRLLATRLSTACADLISQDHFGVMVAARGDDAVAVPLEDVAGNKKLVPQDHPWVVSAQRVGTCLGMSE